MEDEEEKEEAKLITMGLYHRLMTCAVTRGHLFREVPILKLHPFSTELSLHFVLGPTDQHLRYLGPALQGSSLAPQVGP